jgi:hypothetical protein
MLDLLKRMELIKNKGINSNYAPGSVEKVFEYNERCELNEHGSRPVIIKPEPEEKKKNKSIN